MSIFITENIISENGFTASTTNLNSVNTVSSSATTYYGSGANLTNLNVSVLLTNPNNSIQFNNNGLLNGKNNFLYSGDTLLFTGTSRFNGLFYRTNSPSVKQIHQWNGTITPNTATPGIIWTNMPAGLTTWLHTTNTTLTQDATYVTDLTEYTECRLFTSIQVAGAGATTLIKVQYATTIAGAYSDLVSLTIGNTTGAKDTLWQPIPTGANGLVFIRLVGQNGNGVADPRFSPPILLIR
jgi:hypothetical protein